MDYPRPDMARERWLELSGTWEFGFDQHDAGIREAWFDKKLPDAVEVPYAIESEASGLTAQKIPPLFWYAREFRRNELPPGTRFFLCFGAVDYAADVWVNGRRVGGHRGGYTPFSFEITDFIDDTNRISLRVADRPTWRTLRGKQYIYRWLSPVFYTPASGIWQQVYIYATGDAHLRTLAVLPDMDRLTLRADVDAPGGATCEVRIVDPDGAEVTRERAPVTEAGFEQEFVIERPRRWSVERPDLYRVEVKLLDGRGETSDRVVTHTGLRRVEANGNRVLLNGKPITLKMLLVQGYYPVGHYTPTGEAEIEREIKAYKSLGFNGIRIHQKIEDPRYLALCDRHGLLVWEEMPSPFLFGGVDETQYGRELSEVLARDASHPSIMAVVLFNETWGVYGLLWSRKKRRFVEAMYHRAKEANPNVLVVDNSGYDHLITDVVDVHHYLSDEKKIHRLYALLGDEKKMSRQFMRGMKTLVNIVFTHVVARAPYLRQGRYRGDEPFIVSEFGGAGYYKGAGDFMENFARNVKIMREYPLISGFCLTQAYDVENEKNGLLHFDRSPKYPADRVRAINEGFGKR
jgi:beta-galactosidase/beta-glucuronidase